MREILFRGFHECEKGTQKAYYGEKWHKGEWVYGAYFCLHHNDKRDHIHHFIIAENTPLPKDKPIGEIQIEVAPETVCQYTEIDDKNSKKIFDGDIVKKFYSKFETDYLVGVVIYREDVSSYMVRVIDSICPMSTKMRYLGVENHPNSYEITGNKFSKPELLEVQK